MNVSRPSAQFSCARCHFTWRSAKWGPVKCLKCAHESVDWKNVAECMAWREERVMPAGSLREELVDE